MRGSHAHHVGLFFCSQTLRLRFEKQCKTAQRIAEMLEKHPKVCCCCVHFPSQCLDVMLTSLARSSQCTYFTLQVEKVCYPGLKSFAQKELAEKQHMNGLNGSMLWFEVFGGTEVGICSVLVIVTISK